MEKKLTAIFEQVREWWIGYVEGLPGANTRGKTLEETCENLKEAVQIINKAKHEPAQCEATIDEIIIAQAEDDTAWEEPISVKK